jgi:hypothetical protein
LRRSSLHGERTPSPGFFTSVHFKGSLSRLF